MSSKVVQKKSKKGVLILFGSRATGTFEKNSDYDLLYLYERDEHQGDLLELIKKSKKRISLDTIKLEDYVHCLRLGCPDILMINDQAIVIRGRKLMKMIQFQNQGITSLTISLCLKKARGLLKNADEYIKDNFLREAAHRLSLSAFWFGAAFLFSHGIIPKDKKFVLRMLQSRFTLPFSLSIKFSNFEIADLEEPPKDEVLIYFKKVKNLARRLRLVTFEDYLNKAKSYLEKAKSHFSAKDYDSAILMAHSAVELAIKGFLIRKTQQAPLYLLEVFSKKKFLKHLETLLENTQLSDLPKLNKVRNAVYHTIYSPTKQDAEFALTISASILEKIEKQN